MNLSALIILTLAAYALYDMSSSPCQISNFVQYNSSSVPHGTSTITDYASTAERLYTAINAVNSTNYALSSQMLDMVQTLTNALNATGAGTYAVIALGSSKQFSLFNVVLQETSTFATMTMTRVDFIIESTNPQVITKIVLTPQDTATMSKSGNSVKAQDKLGSTFFEIHNRAGLFAPYPTSDNEMTLTPDDKMLFADVLAEKNTALEALVAENITVTNGTTVAVPALPLPTVLATGPVGMGPLRPIGL